MACAADPVRLETAATAPARSPASRWVRASARIPADGSPTITRSPWRTVTNPWARCHNRSPNGLPWVSGRLAASAASAAEGNANRSAASVGGRASVKRASSGGASGIGPSGSPAVSAALAAWIASYSKGMKQRVLISAALLHDPEVLILDEPLSGIDVSSAQLFKHLLAELARQGKIILYISHVLEVVERVCARVVIIYRGRIMADDSVEHLRQLTNVPSLEEIFAQLVEQRDLESVARDIVCAIRR